MLFDERECFSDHSAGFIQQVEVKNTIAHASFILRIAQEVAGNAGGKLLTEVRGVRHDKLKLAVVSAFKQITHFRVKTPHFIPHIQQVCSLLCIKAGMVIVYVLIAELNDDQQVFCHAQ